MQPGSRFPSGYSSQESTMFSLHCGAPRAMSLALATALFAAGVVPAAAQMSARSTKGDRHVTDTFKKPSDEQLKTQLPPMQYKVTQHEGTEPPFRNEYWDNHEQGIYVD